MNIERVVLIGAGVVAVLVIGSYVMQRPATTAVTAGTTSVAGTLIEDPTARASAERSAWVTAAGQLFGAIGRIADTQANQQRSQSGSSIPVTSSNGNYELT